MRTTLLSRLALGAVVFAALGEPGALWAAEPVRLTATQMDAVTAAGTVAVWMGALATADGYNTYTSTYTNTSTTVINTPKNTVGIGLGFGTAVACCGPDTYTNIQTAYYAEGDRVIAHSMVYDTRTSLFSFSHGVAVVIAVDVPSH